MSDRQYLFTSESVCMGHPDKVADRICDAILDALLAQDHRSRVACEALVKSGLVVIAGEITSKAQVDYVEVARQTIRAIGYDRPELGFSADTVAILTALSQQSPDIALGVNADADRGKDQGAGDQGMMFGFACNETDSLMPLPIMLAHRIMQRAAEVRESGQISFLRPDGKGQVTAEYKGHRVTGLKTIVLSLQHDPDVTRKDLEEALIEEVIRPCLPPDFARDDITYHINPTGRFVVGGPQGDSGLSGRKIIVDTYGGRGRHGGGSFSGKDPSKVDRSATYASRYVAKNLVAAGLADICEVGIAYAIGVAQPVSVFVDTEGTAHIPEDRMVDLVRKHFDLRPRAIIESLDLLRPIYRATAAFGHFGRDEPEFTWEKTDKAEAIRADAGL